MLSSAGHHHGELPRQEEAALCGNGCAKRGSEGWRDNQGDSLTWAGFGDKRAGPEAAPVHSRHSQLSDEVSAQ